MFTAAGQALCDLALPRTCAGCASPGGALCTDCREVVRVLLAQPAAASAPSPCPAGFPPTWSHTAYDGPVAHLLRACKDAGRGDVTGLLAAMLRNALAATLAGDRICREALLAGERLLVCPMPSRSAAIRERGREPCVELARGAVRGTGALVVRRLVRVRSGGRDQAGLGASERSVNVHGSMRLTRAGRRSVPGRVCVVVDDIVTTGSSLVEACAVLSHGGARHVAAATVAATQRHNDTHPFTGAGSVV